MGIEDPVLAVQDNTEFVRKGDKLTSEIVQNYLTQILPHASEDVIMYVHKKNLYKCYSTRVIKD